MNENATVREMSDALEDARIARRPIAPLTAHGEISVAMAYRVQQTGIEARIGDGATPIGHKIGLTSEAMQRQLGVNEPDFGVLLDSMTVTSGDNVSLDDLIAPRVEAEIAVILRRPLAGSEVSLEAAVDAVGYVVPALEIIDSRIVDWKIALSDTIADNASSALVVVGERRDRPSDGNLAGQSVTLFEDGVPIGSGDGSALLGDPLKSLIWLARALSQFGATLDEGELVLLGAVHGSQWLQRDKTYRAEYSSWGEVECSTR